MVKRRSLLTLGMPLIAVLFAVSAEAFGQDLDRLPQPQTTPDSRPVYFDPAMQVAHPEGPAPSQLHRLWQFVTFRQPPRPRECQGCIHSGPSSRCYAPLYTFFENRYPTSN
jgi:hypothetical protein